MDIYARMQRDSMERSPFVFLLQSAEVETLRKAVSGIQLGLMPDRRHAMLIESHMG